MSKEKRNPEKKKVAKSPVIILLLFIIGLFFILIQDNNLKLEDEKKYFNDTDNRQKQNISNRDEIVTDKNKTQHRCMENNRYYYLYPESPLNLKHLSISGYYTGIILTAEWCSPCQKIRDLAPNWLEKYKNLVFIDVDLTKHSENLEDKNIAFLQSLVGDTGLTLPAVLMISPDGVYMNPTNKNGVAPPISGVNNIISSMKVLEKRFHQEIVRYPEDVFQRVAKYSSKSKFKHYAYIRDCK